MGRLIRMQRLGLTVLLACAAAGAVEVRVTLDQPVVYIGAAATLTVSVQGTQEATAPVFPAVDGLQIQPGNRMQQTSIVNGRRTVSVEHQFAVVAVREGVFTIPGPEVTAGGVRVQGNAVTLTVSRPPATDRFIVRQSFSKPACYVFEPITYSCTVLAALEIRETGLRIPFLLESSRQDAEETFRFGGTPAAREARPLVVYNQRFPFALGTAVVDGVSYTSYTFTVEVTPLKAGVFAFGPAGGDIASGEVQNYTRDFFGNVPVFKKYYAVSGEVGLEVREVPAAGRPALYTGAVGVFTMQAALSAASGNSAGQTPLKVYTTEPLTLALEVGGRGLVEKLPAPAVAAALPAGAFVVGDDMVAAYDAKRNIKTFTVTLRVLDASVKALPALEYPYFDVDKGAYGAACSQPVPLEAIATEQISSDRAQVFSAAAPGPGGQALRHEEGGLAGNYEGPELLVNRDYRRYFAPAGLAMAWGPLAAALGLWAVAGWSRRWLADPAAQRRRGALGRALARVGASARAEDPAAELAGAVRGYTADISGRTGEALTAGDVRGVFAERGVPAGEVQALEELLAACEAHRYGGTGAGDAGTAAARARAVLKTVDRYCRLLVIGAVCLWAGQAGALESDTLRQLEQSAAGACQRGLAALKGGDSAAAQREFRAALVDYRTIVDEGGIRSGPLYFNLGNCCYHLGGMGEAVYYYRMAMRYLPRDKTVQAHYALALRRCPDVVTPPAEDRLRAALLFWHYQTSVGGKVRFAALMGLAAALAIAAGVFLRRTTWFLAAAVAGMLFVGAYGAAVVQYAGYHLDPEGVITSEVTAYKTSALFAPSFETNLHPGLEFTGLAEQGHSLRIRLRDGRDCWIQRDAARMLE
ncbi:MAG: BatD family protein [Planctomycetota bacterium]